MLMRDYRRQLEARTQAARKVARKENFTMTDPQPLSIDDVGQGIQARFPDGHTATLLYYGVSCTCGRRQCEHIRGTRRAFRLWAWRAGEKNMQRWGPTIYRGLGLDPRIFIPELLGEQHFARGEAIRPVPVDGGTLFLFPDGAYLAIVAEHPDGLTKCSLCHSRECKHVHAAQAELRRSEELVREAAG